MGGFKIFFKQLEVFCNDIVVWCSLCRVEVSYLLVEISLVYEGVYRYIVEVGIVQVGCLVGKGVVFCFYYQVDGFSVMEGFFV